MNNNWSALTHFAGLDWADDHHDIVILDATGAIAADFRIAHSQAGWEQFREHTKPFPGLAFAVETSNGIAVDQLVVNGCIVYPVNPISAASYRKRKAPSGSKTDHLDAWALAAALRAEGQDWKPIAPNDPLAEQLRLLCRDEVRLIQQRTLLVNQLQQALKEYYPAALEAFDKWVRPATWEFVLQFPTPQQLVQAGKRRWEKFLHAHLLWRPETATRRLEIFARADQFCGRAPVTAAKAQLALSLVHVLKALQTELDHYQEQIQRLFRQHANSPLFDSLPGAKAILAPRLLAELFLNPERFPNPETLQAIAGTAPVSYQSGQMHRTRVRHYCDKHLRHVMHLWTNATRQKCSWAAVYYQQKRTQGKSHACALRCLGQRWSKILWKMTRTHRPYDAELHQQNQLKHGSWVLTLKPTKKSTEPEVNNS
jgi:transposase